MPFEDLSNADLSEQIELQLEWLNQTADFVERITRERGERTYYDQGNSNTHTIHELHDFADFSFKADTGQSMMGGDSFYIWYHPGELFDERQRDQICELHRQGGFQELKSSRVMLRDVEKWRTALAEVIRDEQKIADRIKAEKIEAEERCREEAKAKKERERLEELATHLGL